MMRELPEVTRGGVIVMPIASQQSALRILMMLVRFEGQQDLRMLRGWSWGLVVLLRF